MRSIELDHVSKSYTVGRKVLDDVTFREEGSGAVGYLGPNGAGKTTTLKILVGLLRPSTGRAFLNGLDPRRSRRAALWDVGAIVESPEPYPAETVYDALERVGGIRGLDADTIDEEIDRCYALLHLPPMEARCGWLSKGERQRVVLAAAILGDPQVLLLDEPTNGMDPGERIEVRRFLNRLKRDHLIFMSSHLIPDVAEICDRLLFIDRGKIRAHDTLEHIAARVPSRSLLVEFVAAPAEPALPGIAALARRVTPLGERRFRIAFDGGEAARARLLEACLAIGPVASFSPALPPLEEAYRSIIAEGDAAAVPAEGP